MTSGDVVSSGTRQVRLGDLVSISHGWPFQSAYFSDELTGLPIVVNIGNFRYTGGFRFESTITKEYRGEYPKEFELSAGEILLVMTCQTSGGEILGIPARVPDDGRQYLHNQRLGRVKQKSPDLVDYRFLYWLFLSPGFNRHLVSTATGTKILHTAPARIEAYRFPLPSIRDQRRIAEILGALDDKIELNRRMNETLEALARTLLDELLARSSGEWEERPLGDYVSLQRGTTYKSNLKGLPGPYLLGLGSIRRNGGFRGEKLETYGGESPSSLLLHPGDIYVSLKDVTQSGDLLGAVARVPASVAVGRLTQDTVKLVPIAADAPMEIIYRTLLSESYREYCRAHATGTTNLGLSRDDFLAYEIVCPPDNLRATFDEQIGALNRLMELSDEESDTLAQLRDALLPKLLSGEIKVTMAEKELAAQV